MAKCRLLALSLVVFLCHNAGRTFCQRISDDWDRGSVGKRSEEEETEEVPKGSSSLVFVFDVTGSMGQELRQVIDGAAKILATMLARREKIIYNYVLVPFHDPAIGPVTVTREPAEFLSRLRSLTVSQGADCPEMSVGAVKLALNVALPQSFVYVFTDAWAKDFVLLQEVLKLVQEKQSQVVFVLTGECDDTYPGVSYLGYLAYEKIASTSSGQVFHLHKSDVDEVLNFVKATLQARKVNLLAVDRPSGFDEDIEFTVDRSLVEFTLSIAGNNTDVFLTNPDGVRASDAEEVTVLLSLSNVQVLNVKRPSPGLWRLKVASEGPHTVRSTGLSQLDFVHGFSNGFALGLEDTKHRPLTGVSTTVLVQPVSSDESSIFLVLETLDLRGNLLDRHPLVLLPPLLSSLDGPRTSAIYRTPPFLPPQEYFYLRVIGRDSDGNEFQRITTTAINAELPGVPEVSTPALVTAYVRENVSISCNIRSLVPAEVQWYRNSYPVLQEQQIRKSPEETELRLSWVGDWSKGMYSCNATNMAGTTVSTTYLEVKGEAPPPSILRADNVTIILGQSAVLHCPTISDDGPSRSIKWTRMTDEVGDIQGRSISDSIGTTRSRQFRNGTLVLQRTEEGDAGWYRCMATSTSPGHHRRTEARVYLHFLAIPQVQIHPAEVTFQTGSRLSLLCSASGHPASVQWHRRPDTEGSSVVVVSERFKIQGPRLTIESARRQDEGQFICTASNRAGTDSKIAPLRYTERPKVSLHSPVYSARPGESVTLRCLAASGVPRPDFRWLRGSRDLGTSLSYVQPGRDGTLRLIGVQETDAGKYVCVAFNEVGEDRAEVMLSVGVPVFIAYLPDTVSVPVGSSANITCASAGTPPVRLVWTRQTSLLDNAIVFQVDDTLLIRDADPSQEGTYICSASNDFGQDLKSLKIKVTGIVPPLLGSPPPSPLSVITGDRTLLPCPILVGHPPPRVRWFLDGRLLDLPLTSSGLTLHSDGSSLEIRKASDIHNGRYQCLVDNFGGNATAEVMLHVYAPPTLSSEGLDGMSVVAPESSSALLPCDWTGGFPVPRVFWTKDGEPLSLGEERYSLASKGSLKISPIIEADYGNYECVVTNSAGVVRKVISLEVLVLPRISPPPDGGRVQGLSGDVIILPCQVHSRPPSQISWTKDSFPVDPGQQRGDIQINRVVMLASGGLRLEGLSTEDNGQYVCRANNGFGEDTLSIDLRVLVPPSILEDPDGVSVPSHPFLRGSNVTLSCNVVGDPLPVVQWQRAEGELPLGRYLLDTEGRTMTISDLRQGDSDLYWCVAENLAGTASRNYTVLVHEPPKILDQNGDDSKLTVLKGESIEIPCLASGYPEPEVQWRKDSLPLEGLDTGVTVEEDGTLSVREAFLDQSGIYSCLALNSVGQDTREYYLMVIAAPTLDTHSDGREVSVTEGDTAILTCPVSGGQPPPIVTWYREGRSVTHDGIQGRTQTNGFTLSILDTAPTDAGIYSCSADNEAGQSDADVALRVLVPPKFRDFIQSKSISVEVVENQNLTLACIVDGIPTPKVEWSKENQQVAQGPSLTVGVVSIATSGSYTCRALNEVGSTHQHFEVSVLVPPRLDDPNHEEVKVVSGLPVTLSCPVSGNPLPTVVWQREGRHLTETFPEVVVSSDGRDMTLGQVRETDRGEYLCVAQNRAGDAEKVFTLKVLVGPVLEGQDEVTILKATEGSSLVLDCGQVVRGDPVPVLSWLKDGHLLLSSSAVFRLNDLGIKDEGRYACIATNQVGVAEKNFQLKVIVPPRPLPPHLLPDGSTVREVLLGLPVTLTCPLFGHPSPELTWWRDDQRVVNGSGVTVSGRRLTIERTAEDHSGQYQCLAINEGGQAVHVAPLNVLVPATIHEEEEGSGEDRRVHGRQPQVREGSKLLLECPIRGNPRPDIVWLRNGHVIGNGVGEDEVGTARHTFLDGGSSLIVHHIKSSESGKYTCVATNVAGTQEKTFEVNVLVAPTPDLSAIDSGPRKVLLHRSLTLLCPMNGHPPPTIRWLKDGRVIAMSSPEDEESSSNVQLSRGGRQLIIVRASEVDAGHYDCLAENQAGNSSLRFFVHVLVPPRLKESMVQPEVKRPAGQRVDLVCPVEGYPSPTVTWLKDGVLLTNGTGELILFHSLEGVPVLTLISAQSDDSGSYTCVAGNEGGTLEHLVKVQVQVPPQLLITSSTNKNKSSSRQTVQLNHPVTLFCPVSPDTFPSPRLRWTKDGRGFRDPRLTLSTDGGRLVIHRVRATDAGLYSCTASNEAGSAQLDIQMDVQVPPIIRRSNATAEVMLRGTAVLECSATGLPLPSVVWLKDGRVLEEDVRNQHGSRTKVHVDGSLILEFAGPEDTGSYVCVASNAAGSAEKIVILRVLVPPTLSGSYEPSVSVLMNRPLVLECPVSGGDPAPTLFWTQDGNPIPENPVFSDDFSPNQLRLLEGGQMLKVLRALGQHRGEYQCRARNFVGEARRTFQVKVHEPPALSGSETGSFTKKTLLGHPVHLNCSLVNRDIATRITWLRDGRLLSSMELEEQGMSLKKQHEVLAMRNLSLGHSGHYACLAENEAGIDKRHFLLVVQAAPRITESGSPEDEPQTWTSPGQQITLECSLSPTVSPIPTLSWSKDGRSLRPESDPYLYLSPNSQRLHLMHVRPEDDGLYLCLAVNDVGEDQRKFRVRVSVPPRFVSENEISDSSWLSSTDVERRLEVAEGRDLDLQCRVDGKPLPKVIWFKKNLLLETGNGSRFSLRIYDQVLMISSVQLEDEGPFTCRADSSAGSIQRQFRIIVQVPAKILQREDDGAVSTRLHQPTQMYCDLRGHPPPVVTWLRQGRPLRPLQDPNLVLEEGGARLRILRTRLQDEGLYVCLAANALGQDSKDFRLNVQVPVTLDRTRLDPSPIVVVNRSVHLECSVSGTPHVEVRWTHDGKPLTAQPRLQLSDGGQKLTITEAKTIDAGLYLCTASNGDDYDELTFNLTVLVPPSMLRRSLLVIGDLVSDEFEEEEEEEILSFGGESLSLRCPVSENSPPASVVWWKDGIPLSPSRLPLHLQLSSEGLLLRVVHARPADRGRYLCVASNVAGDSRHEFKLDILEAPNVEGTWTTVKVVKSHSVTLECSATGHPSPQITWLMDGQLLSNPNAVTQLEGRKLRLTNVQLSEEGLYTCVAFNDAGADERNFTLQVMELPTLVASTTEENGTVALEGGEAVLRCPVRGRPTPRVLWFRDRSHPLPTSSSAGQDGLSLVINSVHSEHAGHYICVAVNEAGDVTAKVHLRVLVPATVQKLEMEEGSLAIVGQPLRLVCEASGSPPPQIIWDKDGQPVGQQEQEGPRLGISGGGRYLDIRAISQEDQAVYGCTVVNQAGQQTRTLQLDVVSSPVIEISSPNDVRVLEFQTLRLECPVSGDPLPSVVWMKGGKTLIPGDSRFSLEDAGVLTLSSAYPEDSGLYVCWASNLAGNDSRRLQVDVLVPPTIVNSSGLPHLIWVPENGQLSLNCLTTGNPSPDLVWLRDGLPIPEEEQEDRNPSELKLEDFQLDQEGVYVCEASNAAGRASKVFKVMVTVPPRIPESLTPALLTPLAGSDVRLECPTQGRPTPTIRWLKNDRPFLPSIDGEGEMFELSEEGRVLKLVSSGRGDSALYTCLASNRAGTSSKKFELSVLEPPQILDWTPRVEKSFGESLTLSCLVQGFPVPEIRWLKDGFPYPASSPAVTRELSMEILSPVDEGHYTCLATSESGHDNRTLRLTINLPPTVDESGEEIQSLVGHPVELPCRAKGSPAPVVVWHRSHEGLLLDTDHDLLDNGSLLIRSSSLEDGGLYICLVTNKVGSLMVKRNLNILVPAAMTFWSPAEILGVQGQDLSLHCTASGVPEPLVKWERLTQDNSSPIPMGPRHSQDHGGKLRILMLQPQDSGLYRCLAFNQVGKDAKTTQVLVQTPPAIQSDQPSDLEVVESSPVTLTCRAQGFPPPQIAWHLNGVPLDWPHSGMKLQPSGDLIIDKAQVSHNGTYLCVASNDAGRQYQWTSLTVLRPPTLVQLPEDTRVATGKILELTCSAEGRPPPLFTWYHNGTKLPGLPWTQSDGRSTLTIEVVTKGDAGKYVCLAENKAGVKKAGVDVYVTVPPVMLTLGGGVATRLWVPLGQPFSLECPVVEGDPAPDIAWLRNGQHLILTTSKGLDRTTLLIRNVTRDDAGEYRCVASNAYGTAESVSSHLSVSFPPSVLTHPRNQTVERGSSITLDCFPRGSPNPQVRWTKGRAGGEALEAGGGILLFNNGSLHLSAVGEDDEDIYTCTATNTLGESRATARLLVRVSGQWSSWGSWGPCQGPCGSGTKRRHRKCTGIKHGGDICSGPNVQSISCPTQPCPVDGAWSAWSEWGGCSATCGDTGNSSSGIRKRHRKCSNPPVKHGGKVCLGDFAESQSCLRDDCPVSGGWSEWSSWSVCSRSCGGQGVRSRNRLCDRPLPYKGGKTCEGPDRQQESCGDGHCPEEGGWGAWGPWTGCAVSCGGGKRERLRPCDAPVPRYGGKDCSGNPRQLDFCNTEPCPVHGWWSAWSPWGECSSSCGQGFRKRFRTCGNPSPAHGGRMCPGPYQDSGVCVSLQPCPVQGRWSSWGAWSACSSECGRGRRQRSRRCGSPAPSHEGRTCPGESLQSMSCFDKPCGASPRLLTGHLVGEINGREFGLSKMMVNASDVNDRRVIYATVDNIPHSVGLWISSLIPLLSPLYWSIARETDAKAVNGYSLTKGIFKREGHVAFVTGETLQLSQVGRGLNEAGHLQVDTVVSGHVPEEAYGTKQDHLAPYSERYVRTGPRTLSIESRRSMTGPGGYLLPEAWNHTVNFDPGRHSSSAPSHFTQTLKVENISVTYDSDGQKLNYSLSATIGQGDTNDTCPQGFRHEHPYCKDIDECFEKGSGDLCSNGCSNTLGGFLCTCPEGYTLDSDGRSCADLDECLLYGCAEGRECQNSIGSYSCSIICEDGFQLDGDDCLDVDECLEGSHECSQVCLNVVGSYRCLCQEGFQLVGTFACLDIDECGLRPSPCSQDCTNSPGSYRCSCAQGYRLLTGGECSDIDECSSGQHTCTPEEHCKNVPGHFECTCPPGLAKGHNGTCQDVNECASDLHQCHSSQTCLNTERSYRCSCPLGFSATADGQPCLDVDECLNSGARCQHQCQNTAGSYSCLCPVGYRLANNGNTCQDVDECLELGIHCGPDRTCFNTKGKFKCLETPCPSRYTRDTVTGYCKLACKNSGGTSVCPPNAQYVQVLTFKTVALTSDIGAYQDLVRLSAQDGESRPLPHTTFSLENGSPAHFRIRPEGGRGVLYTRKALEAGSEYKVEVRAVSFRQPRDRTPHYVTHFAVFISVSNWPY